MSENQQWLNRVQRTRPEMSSAEQTRAQDTSVDDAAFDALLDDIDAALETNAEDYVRSFVQKGGQ